MSQTTPSNDDKDMFIRILKGKEVPIDALGRLIKVGDIIVYGTGTNSRAELKFGKVVKFNYRTIGVECYGRPEDKGKEKLTSIVVQPARKPDAWEAMKENIPEDRYRVITRKQAIQNYRNCMVLDSPPEEISNAFANA